MTEQNSEPLARLFDSTAPIKVIAARCVLCGCIVYSRCASDRRTCQCGNVSLQGGVTPTQITTGLPEKYEWLNVNLDRDLNDLYYDWLLQVDRFGLVYPAGNRMHVTGMKYILAMWGNDGVVCYEKKVV